MPRGRVAKRKRFAGLSQIPLQGNDGHSLQGDADHHAQQGDVQHGLQQNDDLGHHLQQGDVCHHSEHGDVSEQGITNRIFLKVEGDNFNPSGASRQLVNIFKKSFSGAWVTWGKIPKYVRDRWFNEFQRLYYWNEEDKMDIRSHFEHVGSVRLSNTMNKAKKEFYKNTVPKWISEVHWKEMMIYWKSDDFKSKSLTNTKNRLSSSYGGGPSLHTGGSIPISEYRRKYVKEKGEEPSAAELFFMTHKTKKNEWVDTKSKAVWVKFKKIIKKRIDDASRMQDGDAMEGQEVDEEETTDEETNDEDDAEFVSCQSLLSKEQVTNAWIEAAGGVTKGRLYGLGSHSTSFVGYQSSTSALVTHNFDSSNFQETVNRVVEEKLSDMREKLQEEMQATIQAAIESMRSSQPPI